jgi:hypothetical protein
MQMYPISLPVTLSSEGAVHKLRRLAKARTTCHAVSHRVATEIVGGAMASANAPADPARDWTPQEIALATFWVAG